MQSLKKFYFGRQKAKVPNTFIGGIGATINTPALLASRLGISESRIKLFKVTGVDVECAIVGGSYTVGSVFLSIGGYLTSFYDKDGLVSNAGVNMFLGMYNFRKGYLPGVTSSNSIELCKNCISPFSVTLPNCLSISGLNFLGTGTSKTFNKRLVIPKVTTIGINKLDNGIFSASIEPLLKVYAPISEQISNSGTIEGDLQRVITNGGSVIFVPNLTPPNCVTNLSIGTIYNTSAQIFFTLPASSVNAIDYYEVYVNGFFRKETKGSGEFITELIEGQENTISFKTIDIYGNESLFSEGLNVTTTSSYIKPSNLVANFSFDNHVKSSVGLYNWSNSNVKFAIGKLHNCLHFTVTSNVLSFVNQINFSFSTGSGNDTPFTIGMWINVDSFSPSGGYLNQKRNYTNGTDEYDIYFDATGKINVVLYDGVNSANTLRAVSPSNSVTTGGWKHLVVTYNGSKNFSGIQIYINGVSLVLTNSSVGTYTGMPIGNANYNLGRSGSGSANSTYRGKIEQLFICKNYQMPISEISQIYNSGNGIIL